MLSLVSRYKGRLLTWPQAGVDFIWLMNDKERWQLVKKGQAWNFLMAMDIISQLRSYQTVILIGSKKWLRLGEALLDRGGFYIDLGGSPIEKDCYLGPDGFKQILRDVCG